MRVIFREKRSFDARRLPPDSVRSIVWVDGHIVPVEKASIPVFDSAYLYGVGVFETLRAQAGAATLLRPHFERMRTNAQRIGLKIPFGLGRLSLEIHRLLRAGRLTEATLRIILSESHLVIIAKPFIPYPKRCYERGGKLVTARTVQADAKSVAMIKTTSYLTKMLARREAKRRGADEAILLDVNGHVTEGASSNVFVAQKGRLFTPPLSDGLLPGTRRKIVMTLASRLKIPVMEKTLMVNDLITADEVFITSTLKDVMPVGWVDKKKIAEVIPGPMTQKIIEAYRKLVTP